VHKKVDWRWDCPGLRERKEWRGKYFIGKEIKEKRKSYW
jgi:hypothetical protein